MKQGMDAPMNQGVVFNAVCSFCKNPNRVCVRFYHQHICEECAALAVKMIRNTYAIGGDQA